MMHTCHDLIMGCVGNVDYISYLLLYFGFCFGHHDRMIRRANNHVPCNVGNMGPSWAGFLGSGEFFTRTKETSITVVLSKLSRRVLCGSANILLVIYSD